MPEMILHLIAVVIGAIHPDDLVHVAETAQQFDDLDLLKAQLTLVGHILQLTSATLFGVGTFSVQFTHNFLCILSCCLSQCFLYIGILDNYCTHKTDFPH